MWPLKQEVFSSVFPPKSALIKPKETQRQTGQVSKTFTKTKGKFFILLWNARAGCPSLSESGPPAFVFVFPPSYSLAVLCVVLFYYCSGSTMIKISGIKVPMPRMLCGTMLCNQACSCWHWGRPFLVVAASSLFFRERWIAFCRPIKAFKLPKHGKESRVNFILTHFYFWILFPSS